MDATNEIRKYGKLFSGFNFARPLKLIVTHTSKFAPN